MLFKDSSYLEFCQPFCSAEGNHFCNFGRGHHGKHFCEIIVYGIAVQVEMSFEKRFMHN